jgi:hypothetical protein
MAKMNAKAAPAIAKAAVRGISAPAVTTVVGLALDVVVVIPPVPTTLDDFEIDFEVVCSAPVVVAAAAPVPVVIVSAPDGLPFPAGSD